MEIRNSKQASKFLQKQSKQVQLRIIKAINKLPYMTSHYSLTKNATWDQVEEVTPDEWDLAMIKEIEENPEEHRPYLSQEQLMAELGL